MNFVNLTPATLIIQSDPEGDPERTFEPSGIVATVKPAYSQVGTIDGIPVSKYNYGLLTVENIPTRQPKTVFIVSEHAIRTNSALRLYTDLVRRDLIAPDTSPDSLILDATDREPSVLIFKQFLADGDIISYKLLDPIVTPESSDDASPGRPDSDVPF